MIHSNEISSRPFTVFSCFQSLIRLSWNWCHRPSCACKLLKLWKKWPNTVCWTATRCVVSSHDRPADLLLHRPALIPYWKQTLNYMSARCFDYAIIKLASWQFTEWETSVTSPLGLWRPVLEAWSLGYRTSPFSVFGDRRPYLDMGVGLGEESRTVVTGSCISRMDTRFLTDQQIRFSDEEI